MILILRVFSLPHELQCRPFWFPGVFLFPANRHGCRRFTCFVRHTENPNEFIALWVKLQMKQRGICSQWSAKTKITKNISFEVILMFIVNIVDYICRAPASWVSLFAVTLTTHCDDTFRTAHTCPDDTLWRHIPWRHITPRRRIPTWRHIVTTHSLRTHYPLTTHYPVTTHCDDALPPDDAVPCSDGTFLDDHYSLTTLGNDAFPFMLHDPPDRQDPDA